MWPAHALNVDGDINCVRYANFSPAYLRPEQARELVPMAKWLLSTGVTHSASTWKQLREVALQVGCWR